MAALSSKYPTLLDLATRADPNGKIQGVAEVLNQTNEILDEMVWVEGNLPTGHLTTVRTGLPTPTWRKIGGGVQPTKSTTAQITASTGMLEAYSEIDKALADLNGNTAEFQLSESRPHIEGMNIEIADTLFYGNEASEPEAFTGLSPHFNSLSAASGENIINAGGSGGDNASIWLIVWGPETVHGIIPKGSKAGLSVRPLGEVTIENFDGASGRAQAYRTHFKWDAGLVVRDWRFLVRIANIDKSLLTNVFTSGTFSSGANLPDLLFQAMRKIPSLSMGRASIYCSRDIATWVARQSLAIGREGLLSSDKATPDSRFTEYFHGIPMRRVDALAADEAAVS